MLGKLMEGSPLPPQEMGAMLASFKPYVAYFSTDVDAGVLLWPPKCGEIVEDVNVTGDEWSTRATMWPEHDEGWLCFNVYNIPSCASVVLASHKYRSVSSYVYSFPEKHRCVRVRACACV